MFNDNRLKISTTNFCDMRKLNQFNDQINQVEDKKPTSFINFSSFGKFFKYQTILDHQQILISIARMLQYDDVWSENRINIAFYTDGSGY